MGGGEGQNSWSLTHALMTNQPPTSSTPSSQGRASAEKWSE